jgi:hypothetical protein
VPSQTPPFELPVQVVDDDANASAGHAPEDPVQLSATSHWPAEARHVNEDGLNPSTQVLADPLQ